MAKKSFKGGLDSLLSNSKNIPKKRVFKSNENKPLSDDEKHWLQVKNDRLLKELHLWRTGRLNIESFKESLDAKGLRYNSEKNVIY